MPGFINKL